MPTVTGRTAASLQATDDASIISGAIVGDDLILTRRGGGTVNAGRAKGEGGDSAALVDEIPAATNLNTYQSTGFFMQTEDAEASTANNYPAPYCGILQVVKNPAGNMVWQTYRIGGNGPLAGSVWTRALYNTTWSVWTGSGSTGWIDLPYATNWSDYSASYQKGQYKIDGSMVRLRGLVKTAVALTAATTMFTIPSPYWPKLRELFISAASITVTSGAASPGSTGAASAGTAHTHTITHTHALPNYDCRIDVLVDGQVQVTTAATTPLAAGGWVSLEGIYWDWTS